MDRQVSVVGWIRAVKTEYVAACELLDEEDPLHTRAQLNDSNAYTLGRVGDHHVIIACLPKGRYGIACTMTVAEDMLRSLKIRPDRTDGRVRRNSAWREAGYQTGRRGSRCPMGSNGGCIPYRVGKIKQIEDFEITGSLDSSPTSLLTALNQLDTIHESKGNRIADTVQATMAQNPRVQKKYHNEGPEKNRLYESIFTHIDSTAGCDVNCDHAAPPVIYRPQRPIE